MIDPYYLIASFMLTLLKYPSHSLAVDIPYPPCYYQRGILLDLCDEIGYAKGEFVLNETGLFARCYEYDKNTLYESYFNYTSFEEYHKRNNYLFICREDVKKGFFNMWKIMYENLSRR